jgi:hypothetical protein
MHVLLLVVVAVAALEPRHPAPGLLLEERRGWVCVLQDRVVSSSSEVLADRGEAGNLR